MFAVEILLLFNTEHCIHFVWSLCIPSVFMSQTAKTVQLNESESEVAQPCPTLCNPMDCGLPGSSIHGIFQARIMECVATPSSRGSSQPRDQTCVSCNSCITAGFFTTEPPGKWTNGSRLAFCPSLEGPQGMVETRLRETVRCW